MCTMHNAQCTISNMQLHDSVCVVHYTTLICYTLYTIHQAIYIIHYTLHMHYTYYESCNVPVHCTLYFMHYASHTAPHTIRIIHYAFPILTYIMHYTLCMISRIMHCTLRILLCNIQLMHTAVCNA